MRILEVGAGTGQYSLRLAHEGYAVTAVELIPNNLDKLKAKIKPGDQIIPILGNALDLSQFDDESFDLALVLGPMYHLFTERDKLTAYREALRVTKSGGKLMMAYCMNEPTVISYCFMKNKIHECLEMQMLTNDYHCISTPKDVFEMVRTEDIIRLNSHFNVERQYLIATDGATNYMRDLIDRMDEETFKLYLDYQFSICERPDLIGASHHALDILSKQNQ